MRLEKATREVSRCAYPVVLAPRKVSLGHLSLVVKLGRIYPNHSEPHWIFHPGGLVGKLQF